MKENNSFKIDNPWTNLSDCQQIIYELSSIKPFQAFCLGLQHNQHIRMGHKFTSNLATPPKNQATNVFSDRFLSVQFLFFIL